MAKKIPADDKTSTGRPEKDRELKRTKAGTGGWICVGGGETGLWPKRGYGKGEKQERLKKKKNAKCERRKRTKQTIEGEW